MLNFVICDDDIRMIEKLSSVIEKVLLNHDYDAKIVFKTTNYDKLLEYISSNNGNVVFLDIDIAKKIRKINKNCYLIFVTSHFEYIVNAYKFKTFDYLAKPVTSDRLEETIVRLFEDINGLPKRYIKLDNKKTIIDESEILYIKRDGMKLIFHTKGRDYETYSSFNKIMGSLPPNFVRAHKSFIVNINNIVNLDSIGNIVYFDNGSTCDIGPKFKKDLIKEVKDNEHSK